MQETNATETQAQDIAQSESAVALNTPQPAPQTGATHTRPAPQSDASVAVLRAGRDGVTLVQPARPTVPELVGKVALDTISYTDSGDVQLAWRAKPDAMVLVYLDNSPVADLETAADGQWSGNLTAISPGIYTLRLDEIDPTDGMVLSRLETPFNAKPQRSCSQRWPPTEPRRVLLSGGDRAERRYALGDFTATLRQRVSLCAGV